MKLSSLSIKKGQSTLHPLPISIQQFVTDQLAYTTTSLTVEDYFTILKIVIIIVSSTPAYTISAGKKIYF